MDYRKFGECYYIRVDRDDEIIATILDVCTRESIKSATFSGIGGCKSAEIQVFDQDRGEFMEEPVEGMLELVNITGNVKTDNKGGLSWHAHAIFSCKDADGQHHIAAGHLKSATVLYTAEIELRPVVGGIIGSQPDAETGTLLWNFDTE